MPRNYYLSYANLTCRFGDQYVLLDLANEVVLPAFFDPSHSRQQGPSTYIFRNVGVASISVETLQEPQLVVYGRLIKKTTLSRSQTYSEELGLVAEVTYLPSS